MDEDQQAASRRTWPSLDPDTVPLLEHWMLLPDAGAALGISRAASYRKAAHREFTTLHKLSDRGEGRRTVYVVKRSEVEKMVEQRAARAAARSEQEEA